METLDPSSSASPVTQPELASPDREAAAAFYARRRSRIVGASRRSGRLSFNVVVILTLLLVPDSPVQAPPEQPLIHLTTLYIPTDLTQKAPNKGKITKEISAESIAPHPVSQDAGARPGSRADSAPGRDTGRR